MPWGEARERSRGAGKGGGGRAQAKDGEVRDVRMEAGKTVDCGLSSAERHHSLLPLQLCSALLTHPHWQLPRMVTAVML